MAATLEELAEALAAAEQGSAGKSTSVRLPADLHRAVLLATELGMDESFTSALTEALRQRVDAFLRRQALAEHFRMFPADIPRLADVAMLRVEGTDHPAASHPDLVTQAASWVERQKPNWAVTGAVDEAVDEVLGYVEMLAAGVGGSS
jgi:hypothetical protein